MGSATIHALAAVRATLADARADIATAEELFALGNAIGESAQLGAALADSAAEPSAKSELVVEVFGDKISPATLTIAKALVSQRWSSQHDLLAGFEEIGIRSIAKSTQSDASVDEELFAFGATVAAHADLELALRNKLVAPVHKVQLVDRLLNGRASRETVAIVRQLVQQPRGRSVRVALQQAASIIADQAGLSVATVTSAGALSDAQLGKLRRALAKQYGRDLQLNQVVDPALIGGLRVRVGDDVIDSSIATRLDDVRLRLAG